MKKVEIVNLTPHIVTLMGLGGKIEMIQPQGRAMRVNLTSCVEEQIMTQDGTLIEVDRRQLTADVGTVPPMEPNRMYVVSNIVASAMATFYGRDDFVIPTSVIRDSAGGVAACRRLSRVAPPADSMEK